LRPALAGRRHPARDTGRPRALAARLNTDAASVDVSGGLRALIFIKAARFSVEAVDFLELDLVVRDPDIVPHVFVAHVCLL
jgi:hypothetical protein